MGLGISAEEYHRDLQDCIQKAQRIARHNVREAQERQETHYNRRAKHRTFQPGDQVLVSILNTASKQLAMWQGPFTVIRQVGPVDYEVSKPGHRQEQQVYHVNRLKEWKTPQAWMAQEKAVPVAKPDGSLRLCIDFRKLNALTTFDAFPMPYVSHLIERIGEARYISTLDLAKGYWQIPLRTANCAKTAFGTPWGLFKFVRMPFGLNGAAAIFQRLMEMLLAPHAAYVAAYIDDIIIFTSSWEQHLEALRAVLREI
ncbi:hypothetical protein Y1Q_0019774 [Alligator mississippiensis]|uniref:ribonuclease H n=1 Tax=Alligator mississippiensis TaxID=8496 RepID=A0A151PF01_ALLMI|nr:hypothetical protein Y1Q_0019774 [Alligator mississippiensis]